MILKGHLSNLWRTEHNKLDTGTAEAKGKSLNRTVGKYHPPIFPDVFLKAIPFLQGALSHTVPYSNWCSEHEAVWQKGKKSHHNFQSLCFMWKVYGYEPPVVSSVSLYSSDFEAFKSLKKDKTKVLPWKSMTSAYSRLSEKQLNTNLWLSSQAHCWTRSQNQFEKHRLQVLCLYW